MTTGSTRAPVSPENVMRPSLPTSRPVIGSILALHAEEAAHLWHVRTRLVDAPDIGLFELARHDDRIAAHLDGLVIADVDGVRKAQEVLAPGGPTTITLAILRHDEEAFGSAVAAARTDAALVPGLEAALAWVPKSALHGFVARLLASREPFDRGLGLTACALHDVDAGAIVDRSLSDEDVTLRRRALRAIASLGLVAYRDRCLSSLTDEDLGLGIDRIRTAILLGDRDEALDRGFALALAGEESMGSLLFKTTTPDRVRQVLSAWFKGAATERALIRGVGVAGDASHVDWLIEQMRSPSTARLAAESFVLMTGVDLVQGRMSIPQSADIVIRPSDAPADGDVALDEDEGLPWPDPAAVAAWWHGHRAQFVPGRCWFLGRNPELGHLATTLAEGRQRVRKHVAEYLCVMGPGAALFDVTAPAVRQQERLAKGF